MNYIPKVVIIGNCQSKPLGAILSRLFDIDVTAEILVHRASDSEKPRYLPLIEAADHIISQQVNDTYPCQFVRTSEIRKSAQNRLLTIPNLYYEGYTPDLRYLRLKKSKQTIHGPLGEYHSSIIFEGWSNGLDLNTIQSTYLNEAEWDIRYNNTADDSLQELRRRKQSLDIKITDYIEQKQSNSILFYTFNHPCRNILIALSRRIGKKLNLARKTIDRPKRSNQELLNAIKIPIHTFTR